MAATAELARADVANRDLFAAILGAHVTAEWPIEVMRDAQEHFAHQLETGAAEPGWSMWYLLSRPEPRRLVGVVGHYGMPTPDGWVTVGYGICPHDEGRGFASEALSGMIAWGRAYGQLRGWRATTFERHHASVRVLEKNGFSRTCVSPDDAEAPESDRQGRGRLMVWERPNS